jgi:hypothetical protein
VSELESIIPAHDQGALSLPASGPDERTRQMTERTARLAAVDPGQPVLALHFLIGYQPRAFDAAMDAAEPDGAGAADTAGEEPYCVRCGAPAGIFAAHGPGYRHYKGVLTATSKPRPYKADHKPVIGWRRSRDTGNLMS